MTESINQNARAIIYYMVDARYKHNLQANNKSLMFLRVHVQDCLSIWEKIALTISVTISKV